MRHAVGSAFPDLSQHGSRTFCNQFFGTKNQKTDPMCVYTCVYIYIYYIYIYHIHTYSMHFFDKRTVSQITNAASATSTQKSHTHIIICNDDVYIYIYNLIIIHMIQQKNINSSLLSPRLRPEKGRKTKIHHGVSLKSLLRGEL